MSNIFSLDNCQGFSEKINLDDLYERKRQCDLNKFELFKKILNRVHVRIKTIANQNKEKCCWYVVPEIIIGVPKYDQAACIAYIMSTLQDNGFQVKYFHPNTIFISWNHWVPAYVRNEIKKKTGITVDEYGDKIETEEEDELPSDIRPIETVNTATKPGKTYTPITSYKPSGKLVYNEDLLNRIENKMHY